MEPFEKTARLVEPRHAQRISPPGCQGKTMQATAARFILGLLCASIASGCTVITALHKAGVPGLDAYIKDEDAPIAMKKRDEFLTTRDGDALRWLLTRRIETGQTLSAVNSILGEDGERVHDDNAMKTGNRNVQSTDQAYKWGPDNEGRSFVIFFRDGRVVGFDPSQYSRK
jgi:hypothetical protein